MCQRANNYPVRQNETNSKRKRSKESKDKKEIQKDKFPPGTKRHKKKEDHQTKETLDAEYTNTNIPSITEQCTTTNTANAGHDITKTEKRGKKKPDTPRKTTLNFP